MEFVRVWNRWLSSLQRTPDLHYTLGLVEMACYRRKGEDGGFLVVPQVVARTNEVTRAIVHVDLRGRDAGDVDVVVEVPNPDPDPVLKPTPISEEEFYALLKKTSSPDAAQRLKEFVQGLLETHEESLEATFTPQSLRILVYPSGRDDSRFGILTVGTSGRIRTTKGWLDFLAENRPTSVLSSFLDGLASIDSRLRPLKKPDGPSRWQNQRGRPPLLQLLRNSMLSPRWSPRACEPLGPDHPSE